MGPRELEYSFVHSNLAPGNILDVGMSRKSFYHKLLRDNRSIDIVDLLSPATDLTDLVNKQRVNFIQGNIETLDSKLSTYKNILLVSTLEHFHLPDYINENNKTVSGGAYINQNNKSTALNYTPSTYTKNTIADMQIGSLIRLKRLLAPNGKIILTIPYGECVAIPKFCLRYSKREIRKIAKDFQILQERYITPYIHSKKWHYCAAEDCAIYPCVDAIPNTKNGIVLLSLTA